MFPELFFMHTDFFQIIIDETTNQKSIFKACNCLSSYPIIIEQIKIENFFRFFFVKGFRV